MYVYVYATRRQQGRDNIHFRGAGIVVYVCSEVKEKYVYVRSEIGGVAIMYINVRLEWHRCPRNFQ